MPVIPTPTRDLSGVYRAKSMLWQGATAVPAGALVTLSHADAEMALARGVVEDANSLPSPPHDPHRAILHRRADGKSAP